MKNLWAKKEAKKEKRGRGFLDKLRDWNWPGCKCIQHKMCVTAGVCVCIGKGDEQRRKIIQSVLLLVVILLRFYIAFSFRFLQRLFPSSTAHALRPLCFCPSFSRFPSFFFLASCLFVLFFIPRFCATPERCIYIPLPLFSNLYSHFAFSTASALSNFKRSSFLASIF